MKHLILLLFIAVVIGCGPNFKGEIVVPKNLMSVPANTTNVKITIYYSKGRNVALQYKLWYGKELLLFEYVNNIPPEDVSRNKQAIIDYCNKYVENVKKIKSEIR